MVIVYFFISTAVVMFVLDCQPLLAGTSGPLRINCFGSRTIESVECNYDDGAVVESCKLKKINGEII